MSYLIGPLKGRVGITRQGGGGKGKKNRYTPEAPSPHLFWGRKGEGGGFSKDKKKKEREGSVPIFYPSSLERKEKKKKKRKKKEGKSAIFLGKLLCRKEREKEKKGEATIY